MSGRARQVVIQAHGAWSAPIWGRALEFGSISLGPKKLQRPGDGAAHVPSGSIVHFYTTHQEYGKRAAAEAVFAANPQEAYTGLVDRVREVQAKTTFGPQIYNYDLGHLEGEDRTWNDHQTNRFSADIDLLILDSGREGHLSDVFAFCREAHGADYEVYHCCHCRYVEPGHE